MQRKKECQRSPIQVPQLCCPSPPAPGTSSKRQSLLLSCFLGTWKVRGDFHTSFSFIIKYLKSTVSEDEEEQTPHNFWNSNIQTETGSQTDPHPGWRTSYSHSYPGLPALLTTLEYAGAGGSREPCNHTKATSRLSSH